MDDRVRKALLELRAWASEELASSRRLVLGFTYGGEFYDGEERAFEKAIDRIDDMLNIEEG